MAIYVTKPFLPPEEEYFKYVKEVFAKGVLTNGGALAQSFEQKMAKFLGVEHFAYVTNGTIALQLALKVLGIEDGEVITTPFTYVATTSSILWERCKPVFVDIEPDNFTIDADKIEAAVTPRTKAIMAVHVFGYACDVDKIQKIAARHNLKVIYDGAHAFGSRYKGKSLLSYGDISTCSFHATKLFHTVEGGACIAADAELSRRIDLLRRFGHNGDEHLQLGINGKQSEFHAAMGLANFPHIAEIIRERKRVCDRYDSLLAGVVRRPRTQPELEYNYAYYPVVFKSEEELLKVFATLAKADIHPRRYFYPSLNTLPYLKNKQICPVSEDICSRIACLPLYPALTDEDVTRICQKIKYATNKIKKTLNKLVGEIE